jgi:hypothetical protein
VNPFAGPSDLRAFLLNLTDDLARAGLPEPAGRLRVIATIAYTTGTEWLGDIGLVVREVQKKPNLSPAIQDSLELVMSAVHVAWPQM